MQSNWKEVTSLNPSTIQKMIYDIASNQVANMLSNNAITKSLQSQKVRYESERAELNNLKVAYKKKLAILSQEAEKLHQVRTTTEISAKMCAQIKNSIEHTQLSVEKSKDNIEVHCDLIEQKKLKFNKIYNEYGNITSDLKKHADATKLNIQEFSDYLKLEIRADIDLYFAQTSHKNDLDIQQAMAKEASSLTSNMASKLDDFTDVCMKERETIVRVVAENLQTVKEKREYFFKELHQKIEELDSKQKKATTWPSHVHPTQDQQSFSWIETDERKKTTNNKELYNWVMEQRNTAKPSNNTDKPAPSNT